MCIFLQDYPNAVTDMSNLYFSSVYFLMSLKTGTFRHHGAFCVIKDGALNFTKPGKENTFLLHRRNHGVKIDTIIQKRLKLN